MNELLVVLALAGAPQGVGHDPRGWQGAARPSVDATIAPVILCPAYPGDPPWRPWTCRMLAMLQIPPDRAPYEVRSMPVKETSRDGETDE